MKLPAVAIAATFACGILLGLQPVITGNASPFVLLWLSFVSIGTCIFAGLILIKLDRFFLANTTSLLSWALLGFLAALIVQQPRPADYVISLLEQGQLPSKTPLRWHGQLRDDPARLPWGYEYEIEISGVEIEGALRAARGGLRLAFAPNADSAPLPRLHAGDEVAVLTEAKRPALFRDDGAFDRREYLAQQNIDLVATLRSPHLVERLSPATTSIGTVVARTRRRLRDEIDELFAGRPEVSGILRAMLLGDRSFVDRSAAGDFQKTGVFHVLVVAGLHVGAIAFALYWIGRKLRLSRLWTLLFTLLALGAYVTVVEQRAPVLRAVIMAMTIVLGGFFYRRLELLNSAALAALILLSAKPLALRDSSFQLTFVAIGCIAGLAVPWLENTVQPYVRALRGWREVTGDGAHEPRAAQFRIDLRSLVQWLAHRLPQRMDLIAGNFITGGLSCTFRIWELLVITVALQIGMLPLMARDFHRVTLSAPVVNLVAVPLTGIVVPWGFLTLASGLVSSIVGKLLAAPLAWLTSLLLHAVQWFAHFRGWSYRIPGPPLWLTILFFVAALVLAAEMRIDHARRRIVISGACSLLAACILMIGLYPFAPKWTKGNLELTVLDVSQGDSLLVISPGGKTLLIDGGGAFGGFSEQEEHSGIDPGEDAVSAYLWSRGIQKLDVVALTHAHQDHLGGLHAIIENFRVGKLWIGREASSPALARLEKLANDRHIPIEHELRGASFHWDGVDGDFLWPTKIPDGEIGRAHV